MKLQLTQQIIITQKHKYYVGLDYLCLLAKNLYNVALYNIRQTYFKDKTYLNYNSLDKLLFSNVDYKAIPYRQSAQQILRSVDKTYRSFFKGIKSDKNKGYMFGGCNNFDGDLSNWNISKAAHINGMFESCENFTGKGLDKWDVK